MSTLFLTLVIAFGAVLAAIILLGIGWLFIGKNKLSLGACGRNPHECQDNHPRIDCSLCEKKPSEENKNCHNVIHK